MNIKNNNFLKNDIIEIQLSNDESNFYLYIYFSKNKSSIIFKIKELNICDNYFYEKYDLRDFSKKYKRIISDESIEDAFIDIKNIIKSHNIKIEIKNENNLIELILQKDKESDIIFILRKKCINQSKINQILMEKINDNSKKLNYAKSIMDNYNISFENNKNIINNIIVKFDKINNKIKNLLNEINNINNDIKKLESNKDNSNPKKELKIEVLKSKSDNPCIINIFIVSSIIIFIFVLYLLDFSRSVNNDIDAIIKENEIMKERMPIYEYILGTKNKPLINNKNVNDNNKIILEYDKEGKIKSKYNEHNNFIINRYYKHLKDKRMNIILNE